MKNLKNKDDLVNFNIFKLTVKNSLHLVWTPCITTLSLAFQFLVVVVVVVVVGYPTPSEG